MTIRDASSLQRTAQFLAVDFKPPSGSPPVYSGPWLPIWLASVDSIVIDRDSRPSSVSFWFPAERWNSPYVPGFCSLIRVRTVETDPAERSVLFVGFITSDHASFSGGDDNRPGHEQIGFTALDFRWLLDTLSPVMGQYARSIDDIDDTDAEYSATWFNGRRAVFNPEGVGNMDLTELKIGDLIGAGPFHTLRYSCPIFCNPSKDETKASAWTCRDMIRYLLAEINNKALSYFDIDDPADLTGLDHDDFDKVLNHVVIDTLNVAESLEHICRQIGWGFRQDNFNDDTVTLAFYKIGGAEGYVRSETFPTIIQRLYAPTVDDDLVAAVSYGEKLLWTADIDRDLSQIVNQPFGYGAPEQFEFTAELVPAWLDSDFDPDDSGTGFEFLCKIDADLQEMTSPDSLRFYRLYHARGASFKPTVLRKWALNETGTYTGGSYDRGPMFDFADDAIDPDFAFLPLPAGAPPSEPEKRSFGPFNRRLLECLTPDNTGLNTAGIVVEFSFDAGLTWQRIPCAIESLESEAGILITDPNLSEMFDKSEDPGFVHSPIEFHRYNTDYRKSWMMTELARYDTPLLNEIRRPGQKRKISP